MVNNMQRAIVQLPPLPDGSGADDPNDVFLLAMAVGDEADDVVTGDRRAAGATRGLSPIGC
jgi:predicted nucleic acid-binding protein